MNMIRFLAKRKKRAKRMRAIEPSIDFTKLPIDVLPIIIGELFEEYECFRPPGGICESIENLLELRTVCSELHQ